MKSSELLDNPMDAGQSVERQDELAHSLERLDPSTLPSLIVEITDTCNLRCTYCYQSMEGFHASSMIEDAQFSEAISFAHKHKIPLIDLTGRGDIVMHKNWVAYAKMVFDADLKCLATMNMGEIFNTEEIDTLARFDTINVSLDTVDRDVLRSIRKAVDVRTIMYNINMIKISAMKQSIPGPKICIAPVYTAEIASSLTDLARYAILIDADFFQISELVEYDLGDAKVQNVFAMEGPEVLDLIAETEAALDLINTSNVQLRMVTGFAEKLAQVKQRLSPSIRLKNLKAPNEEITGELLPGQTRDCIDPWIHTHVWSDGTVKICCFVNSIGKIDDENSLEDVLNNDIAVEMRRGLVSGELSDHCKNCSFAPITPTTKFRARIQSFVSQLNENKKQH